MKWGQQLWWWNYGTFPSKDFTTYWNFLDSGRTNYQYISFYTAYPELAMVKINDPAYTNVKSTVYTWAKSTSDKLWNISYSFFLNFGLD